MIRLIVVIIVFAVFLAFIVLNLDNRCDISLGLKTFKDIPVFLSALVSFVAGMLFAAPLVFSLHKGKKKDSGSESSIAPSSGGNKKLFGRKPKKSNEDSPDPDDYNKEKSPYGID